MKTMTIRLTVDQVQELQPIADTLTLLGEGAAAMAQVLFTSAVGATLRVGVLMPEACAPVRELTTVYSVTLPEEQKLWR